MNRTVSGIRAAMAGLMTASLLTLACTGSAAPLPGWYSNLDEALSAAKKEGKPVLADFSTDWCPQCRRLEKNTLAKPEITTRLGDFVPVYVDGDRYPELVGKYQIQGYPTLIALAPDGKEITREVGFVGIPQLAGTLDQIAGESRQMAAAAREKKEREAAAAREADERAEAEAARTKPAPRDVAGSAAPPPPIAPAIAKLAPLTAEQGGGNVAPRPSVDTDLPRPLAPPPAEGSAAPAPAIRESAVAAAAPSVRRDAPLYNLGPAPRTPQGRVAGTSVEIAPVSNVYDRSFSAYDIQNAAISSDGPRVYAQAAARSNPTASSARGTVDDLPRPLVDAGATRDSSADAARAPRTGVTDAPAPAADSTAGLPAPGSTRPAASVPEPLRRAERQVASNDPLAPIKRMERTGRADQSDAGTGTGLPAPRESATGATASATPRDVLPTSDLPSADDVRRWIRDADAKLREGKQREATAMYTKVVESDPENVHGFSDRAFIQMCALMVDRDDDNLRRRAYERIREFKARFPKSRHEDMYTVTRATLAVDLGEREEVKSLLFDFPDRFPGSRYIETAKKLWDENEVALRGRQASGSRN